MRDLKCICHITLLYVCNLVAFVYAWICILAVALGYYLAIVWQETACDLYCYLASLSVAVCVARVSPLL